MPHRTTLTQGMIEEQRRSVGAVVALARETNLKRT
jgi:hypothetical protein